MMDDVNRSQSSSQPHPANTPSTPQPVLAVGDPAPPPILTPEELAALLLGKIDEFKAMAPNPNPNPNPNPTPSNAVYEKLQVYSVYSLISLTPISPLMGKLTEIWPK